MDNNIFSQTQINSFAIAKIKTGAIFDVDETYSSLIWHSKDQDKPTETEFDDAVSAWNTEWDAQEYARKRQAEYPSIQELVVALAEKAEGNSQMWDTITAQRLDVKSKFPKPA